MVFSPGIPLGDFLVACSIAKLQGHTLISDETLATLKQARETAPRSRETEALAEYLVTRFCKNKSAAEELI